MKWTIDGFTGKQFGKYEVLCRLAVGGMAEIFLGFGRFGPFLGRPVVLKRILREQREDPAALQMLIDEAKLTATLNHPNVARVLDLEMARDDVVLVIEFISGANTEEVVDAYQARGDPVPLGFALAATRGAAAGLAHAHGHKDTRGQLVPIIHRDVTPRNLMVDFDGVVKVLDFGIARAAGSERRTQVGMVRGTTAYMSPEQAVGKELDPRTDIFSLGVIAHELLTGQRLFYKGNPAQEMAAVYEAEIPLPSRVNRRVPKAIDPVVMRALERKPERRYQSALELIRDLSLAASSTMWAWERCGEMVRGQFASRQRDIEQLLARIPSWGSDSDSGGRTLIGIGGPVPPRVEEPLPKTVVSMDPLAPFRSPRPVAGPRDSPARTDPALDPQGMDIESSGELGELATDTPRASEQRPAEHTPAPSEQLDPPRILRGVRSNGPLASELPTDPRRGVVVKQASTSTLVAAALGALLLGGLGGALIFKWAQASSPPTMGRMLIQADRPAEVVFEGQDLGRTPLTAVFPVGHHVLQLKESGGRVRTYEVEVLPSVLNTYHVVLDSLKEAP